MQRSGIRVGSRPAEDFPDSATEVADFAQTGTEDIRQVAVSSYDAIIRVIQKVIKNMQQLESVAGIVDTLRKIRDTQDRVKSGSQRALDKEDQGEKVEKKDK